MRRCLPIAMLALVALLAGCTDDGPKLAPAVRASASPTDGAAPLTVAFGARVEFGDVPDFTYRWDFGDGEQSTSAEPSHTYAEEGTYVVSVEVTANENGETGTDELEIEVGPPPAGSGGEATETTEPGGGEAETVAFEAWVDDVNAACAATVEAADQVQPTGGDGSTLTDEQWGQLADLQRQETEAIDAAGVPDTNTDDARAWLDTRAEGAELFVEIVDTPPVDPLDPGWARLDAIGGDLNTLSQRLGLTECVGG